jgi:selenocysteine-specific elongation factor
MYVVATAGHVDHGKSTLVRALTGIEPDRLAEERRRGMTIELGFAWTPLPAGEQVAFVDVPGHERFVTTMLAGVGPVPLVLLVVAADEGWKPQTQEHVAAVAALGARHLLLAVTKADAADPAPLLLSARARLAELGWDDVPAVAVSALTGAGLPTLLEELGALVQSLPAPAVDAPVRLWADRVFTVRGAGTVVTGTLACGEIRVGDELTLMPAARPVVVRGLQSLGVEQQRVAGVARVAVNLRGVDRAGVRRGMALVTPHAWQPATVVDAVGAAGGLPTAVTAHVGAAAVPARLRHLGAGAVRVTLTEPLPLHLGDRLLLRDPSSRQLAAVDVADLHSQQLRRRGEAARVAEALRMLPQPVGADVEVERRRWCRDDDLRRVGIGQNPTAAVRVGSWWVAPAVWSTWQRGLETIVAERDLHRGVAVAELRRVLDAPDDAVVVQLVRELPALVVADGRVRATAAAADDARLTPLLERLSREPFAAPDAAELAALGVDRSELADAVRRGRLLRLADGVYVAPRAPEIAVDALAALAQPFSVSDVRQALGGTRRVVVPLLEHLDATRRTRRLADGTRLLVSRPS